MDCFRFGFRGWPAFQKRNCISGFSTFACWYHIILCHEVTHRLGIYGKLCEKHQVMSLTTAFMAFQETCQSTLSMAHHREIMGSGHNVTKTRQCLKCPLTVGNFQNINLLMDAKKYLTRLTVIQDCATP